MIKTMSKQENMIEGILMVFINIGVSITSLLSSVWGKLLILGLFVGATFASISGLIHIILILTFLDLIFGVLVTIKKKGKDKIMSSKLRNSLYKTFFYLLFIMMVFLIEI